MPDIISFDEAIHNSENYNKRHLLLGNGFSISCIPSIFTYKSIFEEADFSQFPELKEMFLSLGTTDFEEVVFSLERTLTIIPYYEAVEQSTIDRMNAHKDYIKRLLIETIANKHPDTPSVISDEKYTSCRRFLLNFISKEKKSKIYSLNYDLLLYWAFMHNDEDDEDEANKLIFNDGFDKEFDEETHESSSELFWQGKGKDQNIFYIHGALHLFQGQGMLEKNSWSNTGIRLVNQAREALANDKFPLFVSGGDSEKKLERIYANPYLFCCYTSFEDVVNGGKGGKPGNTCMFTYGLSFSDNDKHVFNKIAYGRIKKLFVSIYGDPLSPKNIEIIARCQSMIDKRDEYPLEITYYQAESANVWSS